MFLISFNKEIFIVFLLCFFKRSSLKIHYIFCHYYYIIITLYILQIIIFMHEKYTTMFNKFLQ